jgi:hypothetical protein
MDFDGQPVESPAEVVPAPPPHPTAWEVDHRV